MSSKPFKVLLAAGIVTSAFFVIIGGFNLYLARQVPHVTMPMWKFSQWTLCVGVVNSAIYWGLFATRK